MRGSYVFLPGSGFAPSNKIQVQPRFVMAALVGWDIVQGISAGWKMHHAYSLSSIAESQAV